MATFGKLFSPGGYSHKWLVFLWLMIWSSCCTPVTQGRYRCMLKDFIRLGNSCYFLSTEISSWQEAHFRCRDRGAQLAVLASHYEDSTLRTYLERPEFAQLGRWIGGMWAAGKWIWAAQGSEIESERSFVNEDAYSLGETDQWMCLSMDPRNRYLWNNNNCMRQLHYICEAPLARETSSSIDDASPAGNGDSTSVTTSIPSQVNDPTSITTTTQITPFDIEENVNDHLDDAANYNGNDASSMTTDDGSSSGSQVPASVQDSLEEEE